MSIQEYGKEKLQGLKGKIAKAVKAFVLKWGTIIGGGFLLIVVLVSIISSVITSALGGDDGGNTDPMLLGGSDSWEQFKRYVLTNEGGTKEGDYYIVEDDWAGNPTVGHGLCLYSFPDGAYLHVESFKAYGIDSKKLADDWIKGRRDGKVKVEIADKIWEDNLKGLYDSIVSNYTSLGLTEYQCYALTDVKYRRGNTKGFQNKYESLWRSNDNSKYYHKSTSEETYNQSTLFSFFWNGGHSLEGVRTRKKNQWLLFKYGYYKPLNEYWEAASVASVSGLEEGDYKGTSKSSTNGYTFVEYYQQGTTWGGDKLNWPGGSSTISGAGCHATSWAIALTAISGETITPRQINNAYCFKNGGPEGLLNTNEFKHLKSKGITISTSGKTPTRSNIISDLQAKKILVLYFNVPGEWTQSTHFVVASDYKKQEGKDMVYIVNPNKYGPNGWININRILNGGINSYRTVEKK